ncbi:hypothetical protein GSI_07721 [Ganoderma sinense ZZ0214-1]|uniref:Uncharacterized protein n=1 Tax=Ganoderma sinense ZZ0214-1 TaxID=1077348 RepID=A0A2G8S8P4_9APHY|nr:hypothetical protein GSI_07721 [Ganoderma sinense ZZ0214-1]
MSLSQRCRKPFEATPCDDLNIGALELLTTQIAAGVQALASSPSPWGGPGKYYDQSLLRSLHIAFAQGSAIIGGLINVTSPINRIPPEILTTIFALSPRTISRRQSGPASSPCWPFDEIDVGDLHKLPKVCRYWRELALAVPTLWTTVSTHTPVPDKSSSGDSFESESWFRRSIYLPQESSVELVVHCSNSFGTAQHSREKMIEFMLTNAPKTRELHAWDASVIRDMPLFLRSFDASALQHCTIWNPIVSRVRSETRFRPFFSQGGTRLRSLSLAGVDALPCNEFPMLTLLSIAAGYPYSNVLWDTSDLVKFLAGCPRLEEVYVYSKEVFGRNFGPPPPHMSSAPPTRIGLPRLRRLAFTYVPDSHWDEEYEDTAPTGIAYLLSHTAIPSTCDMYLAAIHEGGFYSINPGILNSVRRNVPGKDAVTHVFMRLATKVSDIQLVFPEGSLRLQVPTNPKHYVETTTASDLADIFHNIPELFAYTEELRIHYSDHDTHATLLASSTFFLASLPAVKVLSLIHGPPLESEPDAALHPPPVHMGGPKESESLAVPSALALYLTQPFPPLPQAPSPVWQSDPKSESEFEPEPAEATSRIPFPALDTLWTTVRSTGELAHLEATLVTRRAALGRPLRRLVVSVCAAEPESSEGLTCAARLQAVTGLGGVVGGGCADGAGSVGTGGVTGRRLDGGVAGEVRPAV